jgi:hypothetical protein
MVSPPHFLTCTSDLSNAPKPDSLQSLCVNCKTLVGRGISRAAKFAVSVPLDSLRKNPKHFHSEACFCEENSLSLAFDRRGIPRFARKDKMNCVFRILFARWPLF